MQSLEESRFNNRALVQLILPLMIEQLLAVSVGMFDTLMVSGLGEYAVSAISLVDQINIMLINMFSALATGGAVCASQYLGRRDLDKANDVARQLTYVVTLTASVIALIVFVANRGVLSLIYGSVEKDVMDNAVIYFYMAAASYPFLGLYNAGAASFRAMGNSRVSMRTSVLMNLINLVGNAFFIYVCKWGVFGAALATLIARAAAAILITRLLARSSDEIRLEKVFPIRFNSHIQKGILGVGVPSGMENSVFQLGKILVARTISLMGTSAIAANAIAGSINGYMCVPGGAIGLGMLTVVGQCMGAGRVDLVKKNVRKLMLVSELITAAMCILLYVFDRPLLSMFSLKGESLDMAMTVTRLFCLMQGIFWTIAFPFPNALRAAGDARFTMRCSMISMFVFRVGLSYAFFYVPQLRALFKYPLEGVFWAMYIDWFCRIACIVIRWFSGKWATKKVI